MQSDLLLGDQMYHLTLSKVEIPYSENEDVEYYTTYPKTPEKRGETRLCMHAPKGTPSGSRDPRSRVPTFCITNIVRKKEKNVWEIRACARDHFVTSGQGCFRWRRFRLRMYTRSLPVAPPSQMWLSGPIYYWGVQHYVIKFASDLRQDGSFLPLLRFRPLLKLTTTILLKYCWKWR